ncbi:hypothetical protein MAUB1S_11026 [Mycolicibacterium aubagnense]
MTTSDDQVETHLAARSALVDSLIERVTDLPSFVAFLAALRDDRTDAAAKDRLNPPSPHGPGAHDWENVSIESFLEAAVGWAEDWKDREDGPLADSNPWRVAARIIYAGKYYE